MTDDTEGLWGDHNDVNRERLELARVCMEHYAAANRNWRWAVAFILLEWKPERIRKRYRKMIGRLHA